MCDARLFGPQIAAFSGRIPVQTAPIGGHATMEALAAEVLAHAPPRFALAGLSMGGILAMEVLRQAPDRVAGIALMDTNPLAEFPEVQERRGPQIDEARKDGVRRVMADVMIPNYLSEGSDNTVIPDLCLEMALDLGPEVFVNQSLALRDRPDQRDTLSGFAGPALVLCGRDDVLCPVERHTLMHELMPQSRLEIIEQAGHLTTLEQPQQTNAAVARWLEDL